MISAPAVNRMFGAQAASVAEINPAVLMAANKLNSSCIPAPARCGADP
jgi:hypothetical protein